MRINCEINRLDSKKAPFFFLCQRNNVGVWVSGKYGWCSRNWMPTLYTLDLCHSSFFPYYISPILASIVKRSISEDFLFRVTISIILWNFFLLLCHSVYKHLSNLWIVNSITSWYYAMLQFTIGHARFLFVLCTRRF